MNYGLLGVATGVVVGVVLSAIRKRRLGATTVQAVIIHPQSAEQVDDLIRQGRLINAIKAYRALTGVGLKDAKDAVEARAVELGR